MKTFALIHQRREEILDVSVIHAETAEKAALQKGFLAINKANNSDQPKYFLRTSGHEEWSMFEC